MTHAEGEESGTWIEDLGGDELTRLVRRNHTNATSIHNFLSSNKVGFFWKHIEDIFSDCEQIMLQHGWKLEGPKPHFPDHCNCDPYSNFWYAGKVGKLCWMVLYYREKIGLEPLLARCMEIGSVYTEWEWRDKYKAHILTGHSVKKGAKRGGEERSAAAVASRKARLEAIANLLSRRPEMGIAWAAREAHKIGHGSSAEANRKLWQRHRPT